MSPLLCHIRRLDYLVSPHLHIRAEDLKLYESQVTHLSADSGSGKSLFAMALLGYTVEEATLDIDMHLHPDACSNAIVKEDVRALGMIFQQPASYFNPALRIREHLEERLKVDDAWSMRHFEEEGKALGLQDFEDLCGRKPNALSVGQLQRIYWLMVKSASPKLIIADEPFAHLDGDSKSKIAADMARYIEDRGASLLLITHDEVPRALTVEQTWCIEEGRVFPVPTPKSSTLSIDIQRERPKSKTSPLIQLNKVSAAYGSGNNKKTILQDIDLVLSPGERVGLMGESGSGKSTLLRLIAGRIAHTAGEAEGTASSVFGWRDIFRREASPVRLIEQDPYTAFEPQMTVGKQIRHSDDVRFLVDLNRLGLTPELLERRPAACSGGELQRLCLLATVYAGRDLAVLLIDESLSALDGEMLERTIRWLDARIPDAAILCAGHRYHHLSPWCDRVYTIEGGGMKQMDRT